MKIAIVVFDQFTDLDVFLPWDVLNRVRLVGGKADWEVSLAGTSDTHISMAGLRIPVSESIDNLSSYDAVLFASGMGAQELYTSREYLKRFQLDPSRQLIGSMCSGALLLAALGLIEGEATTYPTARKKLESLGITVVDKSFVRNGNVATAAGCLAGEQLSTWIVTELAGAEMAAAVVDSILPVEKMKITT